MELSFLHLFQKPQELKEESNLSLYEESVFGKVNSDNYEPLRNFIYYKTGDLDKAEDIVQDAFIKIWNNYKQVIQTL